MIRKDLLDFQTYLNRLSLFMRQSSGIKEHIEIFYRQLYQVNKCFDELMEYLNIFNSNTKISTNVLDNIGSIFGCYRKFTVTYDNTYKEVDLNDDDFIVYIKCQIVRQNFKGTNEDLEKLYSLNSDKSITPLSLIYIMRENSLDCSIYFSNYNAFSDDIQTLFLAGYLTIESMGINYYRNLSNVTNIAMFASDDLGSDAPNFYKFSTDDNPQGGRFA